MEDVSIHEVRQGSPQQWGDERMSFGDCLEQILMGRRVRRLGWEDDGTFLMMADDKVAIYTPEDNQLHPLIVCREDVLADDWVIYTGKN